MSDQRVAIKVEALEKVYRIEHRRSGGYKTLREVMAHAAIGAWRRIRHPLSPSTEAAEVEQFHALKDVNIEIEQGERLGIIGRNGAGKSTLLKILSRITAPSAGRVSIKGRVASLLEVGTGFHPELTGRENIYLNGAILGMSRAEIQRKFKTIVDFAGVERFLDTPVKRYSSGMYVRLAFAVAAHLEPDILLVDEVLAVGDASFQKRCLGKMDEAADDGRTILFVSHNMTAVSHLCTRVVVLDGGRVSFSGSAAEAIAFYREAVEPSTEDRDLSAITHRAGSGALRFVRYFLVGGDAELAGYAVSGERLEIHIEYEAEEVLKNVNVGLAISTREGLRLTSLASSLLNQDLEELPLRGTIVFSIPRMPLNVGTYTVLLDARRGAGVLDRVEDAFTLKVEAGDYWRGGRVAAKENPLLVDFDISVRPETRSV